MARQIVQGLGGLWLLPECGVSHRGFLSREEGGG